MHTKRYTADDEFPDCGRCHNTLCSEGEYCGPEYGWARYFRDEIISVDKNTIKLIKIGIKGIKWNRKILFYVIYI